MSNNTNKSLKYRVTIKYRVIIRHVDGKDVYPTSYDCTCTRLRDNILYMEVRDESGKQLRSIVVPLLNVLSYEVIMLEE